MNNEVAISNKFKHLRIERINHWKPRLEVENYDYLFPIEIVLLERIRVKLTSNRDNIFQLLNYPFNSDKEYNIYLSYLIEALDVLPLKIDLAFDFLWKGLELYMGKAYFIHKGQESKNISDIIKYSVRNYWIDVLNSNPGLWNNLNEFIKIMPSQSYEYLGKRLLDNFSIETPRSNSLYKRVAMTNGNLDQNIDFLIKRLFLKYGNPTSGDYTRKVGRILYKLLNGDTVVLDEGIIDGVNIPTHFELNKIEKIDLIVNGLIYTYRNERFHGNTFSPFKSSKASLKTYSHAHYMFLWAYYLVNLTKMYVDNVEINMEKVIDNIALNNSIYEKLYGAHLRK